MRSCRAAPQAAKKAPAPVRYVVRGKGGIRREITLDPKLLESLQKEQCHAQSCLRH